MDVVIHAMVGAATGLPFGRPLLGAAIAIVPDLPLYGPRRHAPPLPYTLAHTLAGALVAAAAGAWFGVGWLAFFAILSHLFIDCPTHGKTWAPMLLWPMSRKRFTFGDEWEFFNDSWFIGLIYSMTWSTVCVALSFVTGSLA